MKNNKLWVQFYTLAFNKVSKFSLDSINLFFSSEITIP